MTRYPPRSLILISTRTYPFWWPGTTHCSYQLCLEVVSVPTGWVGWMTIIKNVATAHFKWPYVSYLPLMAVRTLIGRRGVSFSNAYCMHVLSIWLSLRTCKVSGMMTSSCIWNGVYTLTSTSVVDQQQKALLPKKQQNQALDSRWNHIIHWRWYRQTPRYQGYMNVR